MDAFSWAAGKEFWQIVKQYKDAKVIIGSDAHLIKNFHGENVFRAMNFALENGINVLPKMEIRPHQHETIFIGHRGASGVSGVVNNALSGFKEGIRRRYFGLECDVRVSTDGIYYIHHDHIITLYNNNFTTESIEKYCINLINTDIMSSEVAKADGLGYSAAQIKSMTTASQVGGTEILKITIRGTEPNDVAKIADTYADVVPEVIGGNGGIVEACSIRLIDKAKVPQAPYSPNVTRNTIIGFIVGLIISCSFILIREILDSRIKNESVTSSPPPPSTPAAPR